MNSILLFLIIFFSFLLIVGLMTVLERKILGILQLRVSSVKFSFSGLYQFYLDFLKIFTKGFFSNYCLKTFTVFIILLSFFILTYLFFYLLVMVWFYSIVDFTFFNVFIFILIDSLILHFKVFLIFILNYKFTGYFVFRMRYIFIFIEGLYVYFVVVLFIINMFFWSVFPFHIFLLGCLFLFILVKLFRPPFDYFEIESEFVGGFSLELSGVNYLLWSLIEYALILNNIFLILFIFFLFYKEFIFSLFLFLFLFLICLTFLIRGVLLRVRFNSVIYFLYFLYFFFNILILLIILWFFGCF